MGQFHTDNRTKAIGCVLAAVAVASTQDAITKGMSSDYPVYEAVVFRCLGSLPLLVALLWHQRKFAAMASPYLPRVILRSFILCGSYLAYVLSIAAIPIANTAAIYFTMPFFVAALAGPLLGEHVRLHRWMAIAAGFTGVLIMIRPGNGVFHPAALLALASACGYAFGQILSRSIAQLVPPVVIANWQNIIYCAVAILIGLVAGLFDFSWVSDKSLAFLTRPWVTPTWRDFLIMAGNGVLAAAGMVLFVTAYKNAESNFVAPLEYSAMFWAVLYGVLFFGDFPDTYTWIGMTVVMAAGLFMLWRDHAMRRSL